MIRSLLALCLALVALPLWGHETTRSYLSLTREGQSLQAELRMALRDIEVLAWIDEDLDGALTWGETRAALPVIRDYLGSVLDLQAGGACRLDPSGARVAQSAGIAWLDLDYRGTCPSASAALRVSSRLFAEIDPDHRLYLTLASGGSTATAILEADRPIVLDAPATGSLGAIFLSYLQAGVAHLGGGLDHVVFLLLLMLPAVARQGRVRQILGQVVAAVTAFTLAHALTLTAATVDWLRPPSQVIAVLVAVSILVTALDNLRPFLPGTRAGVAAFFGLIHGFGFASVLSGTGLGSWAFATALLGFNLGIELAQIGVVAVTVFALMALRDQAWLLKLASLAGGGLGVFWILASLGLAG